MALMSLSLWFEEDDDDSADMPASSLSGFYTAIVLAIYRIIFFSYSSPLYSHYYLFALHASTNLYDDDKNICAASNVGLMMKSMNPSCPLAIFVVQRSIN